MDPVNLQAKFEVCSLKYRW